LSGKLTGIDLWRIYGEFTSLPPVVLTSSLSPSDYAEAIGYEPDAPIFLHKPFYAETCRKVIKRFIANI
jgi:hypothetical protein